MLDVYGNLKETNQELPDELAKLTADLLNQYILEDGLKKDDDDESLACLMKFGEAYWRRYLDVIHLLETGGQAAVVAWQTEQNDIFFQHSKQFQALYRQVGHMTEAPYFMTNWSVCFLVELALNACEINDSKGYENASPDMKDKINYVLRFGENLLQNFQVMVTTEVE